jgi:hypothetical protein
VRNSWRDAYFRFTIVIVSGKTERRTVSILALAFFITSPPIAQARDRNASAEINRENACPAVGARRGAYPGYLIDHVRPLCAGGL